jgi:hypothetical protein
MPEYCFAFFGHIDTLPFELFASWATSPLGLASWATLPLGLASWATLPLGLLCLLGYLSILCFLSYLPLGLLLPLGLASWALYRHFFSQAMSHRYCLL